MICIRVVNFTKRWKSLATGSDEEMDVFYHIVSGAALVVAVVVPAVAVTVTVDVLRIALWCSETIVARVLQGRLRCAASPLEKRRFRANV